MGRFSLLMSLFVALGAQANVRHYASGIEQSQWKMEDNSKIQCTLAHPIPRYGKATFTTYASKELNMEFELGMLKLPDTYDLASVTSVAPSWMPGTATKTIADMKMRKQFNGDLPKKAAWTMLSELEKGFQPTIYYQDWYNDYDKISVGLSSINFDEAYGQFLDCISNLLPYSFDDISYTVLTYRKNSDKLTKASLKKLEMIGEYLTHDPNMEMMLVDGYSDSIGGSWLNLQLSKKRANQIKSFISSKGIDETRIQATGHGERKHVASNKTEQGRTKNRRVVVRMTAP